jgi:hypothetical protein
MHHGFRGEVVMRQKSITLRLPEDEYRAFSTICDEKGYSKTGKIREFIRNLVKTEMSEVESSAGEWARVSRAMRGRKPREARSGLRQPAEGPSIGIIQENQPPETETENENWKL